MNPRVFILTWCQDEKALYGSLLTFKTLRVGFPSSEVFVFDNASIPEARPVIKAAAEGVGARFVQIENEMRHHNWLRWALYQDHSGGPIVFCDPDLIFWGSMEIENEMRHHNWLRWALYQDHSGGPIVFCDPDLIFWGSMEGVGSDALLTGRLIPAFWDQYSKSHTRPRLHTSLLLVADPARLARVITEAECARWEADLLKPVMTCLDGDWLRWDTTAQLYAAIPHECRPFTDAENDLYDHIFCGSHVNWVLEKTGNSKLKAIHEQAVADYTQLKGIWRQQDEFFRMNNAK